MGKWVAFIQNRFYYGWVIVGLAMISMAFWYAFRTVSDPNLSLGVSPRRFCLFDVCSSRLVRQAKDLSESDLHAQSIISFCHFSPLYATIRLKQEAIQAEHGASIKRVDFYENDPDHRG